MATFLSLHIKSDKQGHILKILQNLSDADEMIYDSYPKELDDNIVLNENEYPSYLAISNSENGWTHVHINSFKKLYDWCERISNELNTSCIQVMGQTVTDAYYFLMYENGVFRREIDIYHGDLDNIIDKGEKFAFEKDSLIGSGEDFENVFDRDMLEFYCKELGFNLVDNNSNSLYFIMKKIKAGKTINDFINSYTRSKPWWKFW